MLIFYFCFTVKMIDRYMTQCMKNLEVIFDGEKKTRLYKTDTRVT